MALSVDQFSGATADQQINNAILALPASGGTILIPDGYRGTIAAQVYLGTPNATITAFSISSNTVTVLANNNFAEGQSVTISGLSTGTYLNGQPLTILPTGLSCAQFQAAFTHSNVGNTSDSGTAAPVSKMVMLQLGMNTELTCTQIDGNPVFVVGNGSAIVGPERVGGAPNGFGALIIVAVTASIHSVVYRSALAEYFSLSGITIHGGTANGMHPTITDSLVYLDGIFAPSRIRDLICVGFTNCTGIHVKGAVYGCAYLNLEDIWVDGGGTGYDLILIESTGLLVSGIRIQGELVLPGSGHACLSINGNGHANEVRGIFFQGRMETLSGTAGYGVKIVDARDVNISCVDCIFQNAADVGVDISGSTTANILVQNFYIDPNHTISSAINNHLSGEIIATSGVQYTSPYFYAGQSTPFVINALLTCERVSANLGTAYSGADAAIALSTGWGSTKAVSAASGFDQALSFTVTCNGTLISANPMITV